MTVAPGCYRVLDKFDQECDVLSIRMEPTAEVATNRCPVCKSKVVVMSAEEGVIHNAILRVDRPTGQVSAKCSRCKSWVEVPLRYVG